MSDLLGNPRLSDTVLEVGRKLHPRRYHRFQDLRSDLEACAWAETLDWRNNPYDRFLLRREMLHHLEATSFYEACWNIYSYASRAEIAAEVDNLLDNCQGEWRRRVFHYVLVTLPWNLAFSMESCATAALLRRLPSFRSAAHDQMKTPNNLLLATPACGLVLFLSQRPRAPEQDR
jgi:hypothetical protein